MSDNAETEIEIRSDPQPEPTEVVIDKKAANPPAAKIITADEGVEDLKAQVARAKAESERRLGEAQRQIQEAQRRALEAEREITTVRSGAVSTVIDSLGKDKEAARRDYKAAMESGDWDKAAEAQDRLSLANARLVEAERGKVELEAAVKAPVARQPVEMDSVETLARSMGSKRSADWVRSHPEHVVGNQLSPAVMAAHYSAVANGIAPDSDEYFQYIDRSVSPAREAPRAEERARAPVAAPVSRDVAQSPGSARPGTVRLSESQVKAAIETLSPLYPNASRQELLTMYAKNRQDLIDEGRLGRVAS